MLNILSLECIFLTVKIYFLKYWTEFPIKSISNFDSNNSSNGGESVIYMALPHLGIGLSADLEYHILFVFLDT